MKLLNHFVKACAAAIVVSCWVEANAQQPPPQSPNMTFFVTSVGPGKGADLGGLEGADRHCQTLAQGAGAGGKTWRAYLSTQADGGTQAINARDRIGTGPWQNFKGEVIAQNADDLHGDNNKLGMQVSLTERGTMIPGVGFSPNRHDVLTGSQMDGRAFCDLGRKGANIRLITCPDGGNLMHALIRPTQAKESYLICWRNANLMLNCHSIGKGIRKLRGYLH